MNRVEADKILDYCLDNFEMSPDVQVKELETFINSLVEPVEDVPRIDKIRRKFAENPEACHAMLDMINQVGVRAGVLEICCDENHSPNSRTDAILDYLNIPQDLVVDKETDNEIAKRKIDEYRHDNDYTGYGKDVTLDGFENWLDKKPYDPHEVAQMKKEMDLTNNGEGQ